MENVSVFAALRMDNLLAGKAMIVVRVVVKRKVAKTIPTGMRVLPSDWDEKARLVRPVAPNATLMNSNLKKETNRLEGLLLNKSLLGIPLTKNRVKQILEGKDPGKDFTAFCKEWVPQKYRNKNTVRTYLSEVTKLARFKSGVCFGDFDYRFLTSYKKYMRDHLGNSDNTVWKSFKFMNTMINDALKMKGIIESNPFDDFSRGKYTNPDKLGIELTDCDAIEALALRENTSSMIRSVSFKFLLMCYSGLRFGDAIRFDPDIHALGGSRLQLKTEKQGVLLNMKTYDRLNRVIEYVKEFPMPVMTNKDFNQYMKIVAEMAGVTGVKLSAHVGRHTFGELLAEAGLSIDDAQKLLAHRDRRSTEVYFRIKNKRLDDAMDKMNAL